MHSISITYTLIYHISFAQEYKFSKCKKLFNCKSNKQIRQIINGGFYTQRTFKTAIAKPVLYAVRFTIKTQRKPTHFSRWMNLVNNFV